MLKRFSCLICVLLIAGCSFNGVFFPVDERPDDAIDRKVETIQLRSFDGTQIKHYLFKPDQEHKATIFALQGSGSKVVNWYKVIKPLVDDGYQVFMMEYRGFGESNGEASHATIAQDASNALTYLVSRNDVKNGRVIVLGQSYGGQLAIYVTHKHPEQVDGIVTEGTFTSFSDEAAYFTPWPFRPLVKAIFSEPYVSKDLIADINAPLLIIHSTEDKVVPFSMAKTLQEKAKNNSELWQISGKHVAGLIDLPNDYVAKINEFFQEHKKGR